MHRDWLEIELQPNSDGISPPSLSDPSAWQPQGRPSGIIRELPFKPLIDLHAADALLKAIAKSRLWMAQLINGTVASTDIIAIRRAQYTQALALGLSLTERHSLWRSVN
jgi:hypothetical protein